MPKLSVVIPVYNVEKYLSRCLDSVINQTFRDMEIICINDGSPDNSDKILADYAQRDNRIKIITQENQGLAQARNVGVLAATGEYIGFVDSDDWIDNDFYTKLITAMDAENADMAMAGTRWIFEKSNSEVAPKTGTASKFSDKVNQLPNGAVWDKVFRLSLLKDNHLEFPRGRFFEDNLVLVASAYYSKKMVCVSDTFYNYFQNPAGICKTVSPEMSSRKLEDKFFVSEKLLAFASEKHITGKSLYELKKFIARSVLPEYVYHKTEHMNRVRSVMGKRFMNGFKRAKIMREVKRVFYDRFVRNGFRKTRFFGICIHQERVLNFYRFAIDDTAIITELKKLGKFTFIPNQGNMGDMLIAKATYDFLDKNGFEYDVMDFRNSPSHIETIVMGGGGIWVGDLYLNSDFYIEKFKTASRIVMLPSSVYECERLIKVLDSRFVVFAREKQTFDYLISKNTGAKILLDHDMALRGDAEKIINSKFEEADLEQWKSIEKKLSKFGSNTIILSRNDAEKANDLKSDFDLSTEIGSWTMTKHEVAIGSAIMLKSVTMFDKILTDRLHVAIAGLLMNKDVYMFDNSYGKLSAVYNNSLASNPKVQLYSKLKKETNVQ